MRLSVAFAMLMIATPVYAQQIGTTSGATSSINIANPAATTSTNRLITPPTIAAPGLTAAGVETCLGSTSAGLSLMGGGLTFGRTQVDDGCTIRLLARQLFAFGMQKAALALMCQDERVATAMEASGSPCPVVAFAPMMQRRAALTSAEPPISRDDPAVSHAEQVWMERASN